MKAKVDEELCIGCGLCADTCPEVFEMPEDKAKVIVDVVPAEVEPQCREAADSCPTNAISLEE